jgi:hypothetical protein
MRKTMMAAAAAAAAMVVGLVSAGGASAAAPLAAAPLGAHRPAAAEQVRYHGDWRGRRGWDEHRHYRRQFRRAHEEERIAEAARRERWRIERERAERRAWRHAGRERYGYHRSF